MEYKYYRLETYGCQMNKAESEALENDLRTAGWMRADDTRRADLVILNTCSVRTTAEERVWGRLGFYRNLKRTHGFMLAVIGCMSERLKGRLLEQMPEIDIVIGNFQKDNFLTVLDEAVSTHRPQLSTEYRDYHFAAMHSRGDFRALLPVMHGCNNYCSYCIVPFVRGPEKSRRPDEILGELKLLEQQGVREVTLLGQNVNSYRYSSNGLEVRFPDLLDRIQAIVSGIRRVRFLTSHPKDCTRELVERLAQGGVFCRHIHLPVQHGSNRILDLMKRGYTRESYLDLVRLIKNTVSDVTITTDILIGFPAEEDEDFILTKRLMEEVEFDDAYTYYYNPREGTTAFDLGDTVSLDEKKRRLHEVIELNKQLKVRRKQGRVGKSLEVLVESLSKKNRLELLGRTEHDEMVVFEAPEKLIGSFCRVRLVGLNGTTFHGTLI